MNGEDSDDDGDKPSKPESPGDDSDEVGAQLMKRHADRARGILTGTDRDFLCEMMEEEENNQLIRDRRYRIRQRIISGLKDFDILSHKLPENDRKQIFQALHDEDSSYLKQVGILLYLGFIDIDGEKADYLEGVIREAELLRGNYVNVTVTSNDRSSADNEPSTYEIEIVKDPNQYKTADAD